MLAARILFHKSRNLLTDCHTLVADPRDDVADRESRVLGGIDLPCGRIHIGHANNQSSAGKHFNSKRRSARDHRHFRLCLNLNCFNRNSAEQLELRLVRISGLVASGSNTLFRTLRRQRPAVLHLKRLPYRRKWIRQRTGSHSHRAKRSRAYYGKYHAQNANHFFQCCVSFLRGHSAWLHKKYSGTAFVPAYLIWPARVSLFFRNPTRRAQSWNLRRCNRLFKIALEQTAFFCREKQVFQLIILKKSCTLKTGIKMRASHPSLEKADGMV